MQLIKSKALCKGDKVAAITLSWGGAGTFPYRYEAGKKQLEEVFGVEVVATKHALESPDWIYQNPIARAEDLMAAFLDPSIKAIISTIGGSESVRTLPYLDLNVIKENPKIFLGFSDTTVTHFACLKAGLVSFYGPSLMAGFAENGGIFPYMQQSLHKTLFANEAIGTVHPNDQGWTDEYLEWANPENQNIRRKLQPATGPKLIQGKGITQGHLLGGCIEVLEMLKGTDFWPKKEVWKNAILFLETSEEAPPVAYFERWLRNYGSQGILQNLKGIILGRPSGQIAKENIGQYDAALLKVVKDELGLHDLPLMTQMDFGHTEPVFTIPFGVQAEINCERQTFAILENGVC